MTTTKSTSSTPTSLGGPAVRFLALLLAGVLVATACGSDADETTSDDTADAESDFVQDASDSSSDDSGAVESTDGDAENAFAADSGDDAGDAMEEEAMEEAPAESDDSATADASADRAEQAEEGDDGGGLFGTRDIDEEPEELPEPAPTVDSRFTNYGIRTFIETRDDPLSTFALDVDTGSYTIARRFLAEGQLPPRDSVRVEEYVNALDYDYDTPRNGLDVMVDGGPSPFDDDRWIVRVGVQAEVVDDDERKPVALTFVVDTSGSMDRADRLGLVRESLTVLVEELDRDDTVAIVTYSGDSGILLEPTSVRDRDEILDAIDDLRAGGSTNLQAGLDTGYDLAREAFREDGVNRVIVASDGLANAGITNVDELSRRLRDDADAGIGLVTIGYGLNGFNDTTMEQLADQGDGFYSYIDTIEQAEKLFSDELTSTLIPAAIDAKIQVEFDRDVVDEYRLIGYENRGVRDSDFRNDAIDAGELGAGHQATALYEIVLDRSVSIDDRAELGVVRLRWEDPETGDVEEIDEDIDMRDLDERWTATSDDLKQAIVVAAFAEILRDNPYADDVDLGDLTDEADALSRDIDTDDFDEFADMVEQANRLR